MSNGWRGDVRVVTRLALLVVGGMAMAAVLGACGSDDDGGGGASADDGGGAEATTTVASGASGEFSFLSYNVAGLPQEISGENPETNIPLISPLLDDFDIVVTQEDFDWWQPAIDQLDFVNYHTRLRAENDFAYETEQHPGPEAVGIDVENDRPTLLVGDGLGIISRFPLSNADRVPWPGCYGDAETGAGDCLAMKGFAVATVELADGVQIDVYTLHAEAGEGPDDQPLQEENFEVLAAYINEHSAGRPIVFGGDTNLHLEPDHDQEPFDTPIWRGFLEATGLVDVCDEVECVVPGHIDKVAYRDAAGVEFTPLGFRWDEAFVDPAGEDLSDHPAVAVDWKWTAG